MAIPPDLRQIITNAAGTIPAGTNSAGTLSSTLGETVLVGTNTEMRGDEPGAYLYIPGTKEKLIVTGVDVEHQTLSVAIAPALALVAENYQIIRPKYRYVSMVELVAGVTVEGIALGTTGFTPAQRNARNLLPVYKYDATAGGAASVEINVAY